ncbi:hypothetical protein MesoLjLa_57110 [Mesorhizobium sp. L-2-11]|nr:hypothetical protein MesoLjLa_57110 [Mesorhizobium sp. L-2-11]
MVIERKPSRFCTPATALPENHFLQIFPKAQEAALVKRGHTVRYGAVGQALGQIQSLERPNGMTEMQLQTKSLTYEDAIEVWRLHSQGWFQHRIAARFNVNPGRINEVLKEHKHRGSRVDAAEPGRAA